MSDPSSASPQPSPQGAPEGSLAKLVDIIAEDAEVALRRSRDRAANESRAFIAMAEEHVEELERAANELGRVRGLAAVEAFEREADYEIRSVVEGAFDRLFERFEMRVRTALLNLRAEDERRYEAALGVWAKAAAQAMDGPADVFSAPEDRGRLYDALIAEGASDFQVHVDRGVRTGFVVRDLDGRTLLDRRPEAIVRQWTGELRRLLKSRTPPAPEAKRDA